MKIKLSYPDLPPLEIDAEPDECARLLRALSVPPSTEALTAPTPSGAAPVASAPVVADAPAAAPATPVVTRPAGARRARAKAMAATPTGEGPVAAKDAGDGVRRYGGRTNRRFLILECLRELRERGVAEPTMPQITETFATRYPEVDRDNLEQVVRDLVNKTDKVTRLRWGVFQLTD